MKNKMSDLRDHLFETIEMLKVGDERMDCDKAKRIGDIAQVLINSAKVEIQYLDSIGGKGTGFIEEGRTPLKAIGGGE